GCYEMMFWECSNLSEIKVNFTNWGKYRQLYSRKWDPRSCPLLFSSNDPRSKVISAMISMHFPHEGLDTTLWLEGVAQNGTFICPKELSKEFGEDKIPEGWKIKNK
ncbi:MAG: hypothetical protein IK005_05510, partial [Paludibacteraceae bacterium]|nr:hypothetical protein [Paludibacteraceae bacterium]